MVFDSQEVLWRFSSNLYCFLAFVGVGFVLNVEKDGFSTRCDWKPHGVPSVQSLVPEGGPTKMRMTEYLSCMKS